jgi:hypothetical protein
MPTRFAALCLLAVALCACSEKPDQTLVQNEHTAAARDQRPLEDERRQRTLGQGEANRIYNEGSLR